LAAREIPRGRAGIWNTAEKIGAGRPPQLEKEMGINANGAAQWGAGCLSTISGHSICSPTTEPLMRCRTSSHFAPRATASSKQSFGVTTQPLSLIVGIRIALRSSLAGHAVLTFTRVPALLFFVTPAATRHAPIAAIAFTVEKPLSGP
jgi:hypothetical protein